MKMPLLYVATLLLVARPVIANDTLNPHRMLAADGTPDIEKCAVCHTETLDLARPKAETCTLCHSQTLHAGSIEHLRASATEVARALAAAEKESAPPLSLTEDGKIYCGTCHLFHDPAVIPAAPLPGPWTRPRSATAEVVRSSLASQATALAERRGEKGPLLGFTTDGTTALTLPVEDGSLCVRCHGSYRQ